MTTLIIVLILIASVLLVMAVLAQNSKGSGLAGGLGNSAASQIMGAKRTTDFLEKATGVLAFCVLGFSLMANILIDRSNQDASSPNIEAAKKKQLTQPKPQQAPPLGLDSAAPVQTPADTTKK
ncbi:MAG: preprotein translocase subunit SecG [Bernardetiaceae bacterium]|jgi:preprotein translocase subunit SecG|nr:preprotein translocase subunit SecG [Bernardetiaceae bacterium]